MGARDYDELLPGFAEANLRVLSKDTTQGYVPLVLNPIQADRWKRQLATHKTRFIDLKARQLGMSTLHLAKNLMRCQLVSGYTAAVIAQLDTTARAFRTTVLDMLSRQPSGNGLPRLKSRGDVLHFENGARMFFGSAESRQDFTRGITIHSLHCSEYAKWTDPISTLAAAMPAVPPDGEVVIESSPLGFAGDFRDKCLDARSNPASPWEFSFYEWFRSPEYRLPAPKDFQPTPEEQRLIARFNLDNEQLMFRRLQQHDHPTDYLSEYAEDFETCFLAAGDSRFQPDQILKLTAQCGPPVESDYGGLLRIWQQPYPNVAYAVGVDTAEGVAGGDHSAAVVVRAGSGQVVATLTDDPPHRTSREGRLDPVHFARLLAELAAGYNHALICVEAMGKSAGAVLNELEREHHYPNIFHEDTGDMTNPYGKTPGVRMTPEMKSALVAQFSRAIDHESFRAADIRLPQQMADFVVLERTPQGYEKLGARKGSHDDLLIATMLAVHAAPAARLTGERRLFARVW